MAGTPIRNQFAAKSRAGDHREMFGDRAERERREEGEAADDQDDADERPTNSPPVVGNVPADGGIDFFAASEPAIAIAGTIIQKRPMNIATAPVML